MEVIGRIHPLIVHLPIGCFLIACVFQWMMDWKQKKFDEAVSITLWIGCFSALIACVSGLYIADMQAESDTLTTHKWMGFATLIFSALLCFCHYYSLRFTNVLLYLVGLLVIITGHYGGSLTHGEDFLFPSKVNTVEIPQKIHLQDTSSMYRNIIVPILEKKCYACHSAQRQKGDLRLDAITFIKKGGKNGQALIPHKVDQSAMMQRILLPLTEEKHMPPKSKPQLTSDEIALIEFWIQNGGDEKVTIGQCKADKNINTIIHSLGQKSDQATTLPELKEAANSDALKYLNANDVSIQKLSKESHLLMVSFIAKDSITATDLKSLMDIKDHIYILKLTNSRFDKSVVDSLSTFKNLHSLYLENTALSDDKILLLNQLPAIQYLNVVSNKLTIKGIETLAKTKSLKKLFIYGNAVTEDQIKGMREKHKPLEIR